MIAIPEKEHSHSKKHDTVKPFRQGDGGTSRAAGRYPPSLSFISLQPPASLSRAWAKPACPTCVQGSICAALFLQSRKTGRGGRTRGRCCKWSGVAGILESTSCVLSCTKSSMTNRLWKGNLPLYSALMRPHPECCIQPWSPQDRKDISWIQRRTTKLIRGIEYLFYKEKVEKIWFV